MKLDFTQSKYEGTPWTMLLGENATGKSTILQAVAFALVGEKYFRLLSGQHQIRLGNFVRNKRDQGWVKVWVSGFTKPHGVTLFANGEFEFDGSERPQMLLLGYGATRLLPSPEMSSMYGEEYARVDNLFNPFIPLVDAENWLLSVQDASFDYTARALKSLLSLGPGDDLFPKGDRVYARIRSNEVPLQSLSEGYQSVVALTADILQVVLKRWPTPESAEGVVLLDELGNHLHPTWKMRFVESLRRFFPGIQFIATTHDPLCLRGLADGEVVVMERGPRGGISAISDLPSLEGLRIDQLLTSEHFGLQSTVDPDLDAWMREYYGLLRKTKRNSEQQMRLDVLRAMIDDHQRLGTTEREQLMLDAIDVYLATPRPRRKERLKAETMEKIAKIWSQA